MKLQSNQFIFSFRWETEEERVMTGLTERDRWMEGGREVRTERNKDEQQRKVRWKLRKNEGKRGQASKLGTCRDVNERWIEGKSKKMWKTKRQEKINNETYRESSQKNENSVIMYSLSCHSKPVWLFFCWTNFVTFFLRVSQVFFSI